jgi:hypothetical protein
MDRYLGRLWCSPICQKQPGEWTILGQRFIPILSILLSHWHPIRLTVGFLREGVWWCEEIHEPALTEWSIRYKCLDAQVTSQGIQFVCYNRKKRRAYLKSFVITRRFRVIRSSRDSLQPYLTFLSDFKGPFSLVPY